MTELLTGKDRRRKHTQVVHSQLFTKPNVKSQYLDRSGFTKPTANRPWLQGFSVLSDSGHVSSKLLQEKHGKTLH